MLTIVDIGDIHTILILLKVVTLLIDTFNGGFTIGVVVIRMTECVIVMKSDIGIVFVKSYVLFFINGYTLRLLSQEICLLLLQFITSLFVFKTINIKFIQFHFLLVNKRVQIFELSDVDFIIQFDLVDYPTAILLLILE